MSYGVVCCSDVISVRSIEEPCRLSDEPDQTASEGQLPRSTGFLRFGGTKNYYDRLVNGIFTEEDIDNSLEGGSS